jgi:ubiquinone/menaquinone biosynthesis C-methylase UbiE
MQAREVFQQRKFSEHKTYRATNRKLLELVGSVGPVVVDIGTGSGPIPELIYQMAEETRKPAPRTLIAADPQRERLEEAAERLKEYKPKIVSPDYFAKDIPDGLYLVEAYAKELSLPSDSIDTVIMANVLHLIPEEIIPELIAMTTLSIKAEGRFAVNSAYGTDYTAPGTDSFYSSWMLPVLRYLQREKIKVDRSLQKGIPVLNRSMCEKELRMNKMRIAHAELSAVEFDLEFYKDIARHDRDFTEGVLKNIGVAEITDDLVKKVSGIMAESAEPAAKGREYIPRNYYWVVGEKSG